MNILTNMQNQNSSGSGSLPSNTVANPRGDVKAITTRSGVAYDGPSIPPTPSPFPKEVERETEATKDKVQNTSLGSTAHVQPPVVQDPIPEPEVAPKPKPKPSIPYPSRLNDQKLREKDDNLASKFVEIFRELHFRGCSSTYAEICFNIVECLALADLGASINLMPLSIWKKLSLPELTPTRMILELADRSTTSPSGIAEDVFVKVGKFHFLADFVVLVKLRDTPTIMLNRLIESMSSTFHVRSMLKKCLDFQNSSKSRNPTPSLDPILSNYFPALTPFEVGDFILEEIKACLTNNSIPPRIDDADFDPVGDLLLLEKLLNDDPSSPLPSIELNC
ncbi:reverse transcriptase domain-containing protein [Tanacetum coccineum]